MLLYGSNFFLLFVFTKWQFYINLTGKPVDKSGPPKPSKYNVWHSTIYLHTVVAQKIYYYWLQVVKDCSILSSIYLADWISINYQLLTSRTTLILLSLQLINPKQQLVTQVFGLLSEYSHLLILVRILARLDFINTFYMKLNQAPLSSLTFN